MKFRVDNHIYGNEEEDIKNEIMDKNDWVGELERVYKFPRINIIKVTFSDSQKAKKALEVGLKMFFLRIPNHDMRQDTYISIQPVSAAMLWRSMRHLSAL